MRVLINDKLYDSIETPMLIIFDRNEQKMFNGMKRFVSAPETFTTEQKTELINTPIKCPHDNITSWNHGYHNICSDCGERDVVRE